ncbi:hypothetical protein GCM10009647_066580 [Streptomyces sanglieri]|uniref:Uncharacterized protein n=1 Tax=Streptomyces sanglieri TaxID=193460 RepID=A0ABW2WL40_9ACTN
MDTAAGRLLMHGQQCLAAAVGNGRVEQDLRFGGPDLNQLVGADAAGGRRVVEGRPLADDLLMTPVFPGLPLRRPGGEGSAGQDVVADDEDLPFDAASAGANVMWNE